MLLVESDSHRRQELLRALSASGFSVLAVSRLADIERWPIGEVVIVDAAHFSPWWLHVGASRVFVLADTAEEGASMCARGATGWVDRTGHPDALISALLALGSGAFV